MIWEVDTEVGSGDMGKATEFVQLLQGRHMDVTNADRETCMQRDDGVRSSPLRGCNRLRERLYDLAHESSCCHVACGRYRKVRQIDIV